MRTQLLLLFTPVWRFSVFSSPASGVKLLLAHPPEHAGRGAEKPHLWSNERIQGLEVVIQIAYCILRVLTSGAVNYSGWRENVKQQQDKKQIREHISLGVWSCFLSVGVTIQFPAIGTEQGLCRQQEVWSPSPRTITIIVHQITGWGTCAPLNTTSCHICNLWLSPAETHDLSYFWSAAVSCEEYLKLALSRVITKFYFHRKSNTLREVLIRKINYRITLRRVFSLLKGGLTFEPAQWRQKPEHFSIKLLNLCYAERLTCFRKERLSARELNL